jgi:hypothetical protein
MKFFYCIKVGPLMLLVPNDKEHRQNISHNRANNPWEQLEANKIILI